MGGGLCRQKKRSLLLEMSRFRERDRSKSGRNDATASAESLRDSVDATRGGRPLSVRERRDVVRGSGSSRSCLTAMRSAARRPAGQLECIRHFLTL